MAKRRDCDCVHSDIHTRQTTIRLFEDWDREQHDIIAEIGRTIPRNGAWNSSSLPSYTSQLFLISPIARRVTPVPPNAPIKPKKPFSKKGLKPRKLRFTDKEKDEMENKNYSQKNTDFSIKMSQQKAEISKLQGESIGRLDRKNLSTMLQSIRLELDKENRQYGQKQYEKRTRNHRSVAKECAKNNNNSSQTSKLNCRTPKGEFVHFRI